MIGGRGLLLLLANAQRSWPGITVDDITEYSFKWMTIQNLELIWCWSCALNIQHMILIVDASPLWSDDGSSLSIWCGPVNCPTIWLVSVRLMVNTRFVAFQSRIERTAWYWIYMSVACLHNPMGLLMVCMTWKLNWDLELVLQLLLAHLWMLDDYEFNGMLDPMLHLIMDEAVADALCCTSCCLLLSGTCRFWCWRASIGVDWATVSGAAKEANVYRMAFWRYGLHLCFVPPLELGWVPSLDPPMKLLPVKLHGRSLMDLNRSDNFWICFMWNNFPWLLILYVGSVTTIECRLCWSRHLRQRYCWTVCWLCIKCCS